MGQQAWEVGLKNSKIKRHFRAFLVRVWCRGGVGSHKVDNSRLNAGHKWGNL